MKKISAMIAALVFATLAFVAAGSAKAQDRLVVVEMFTAQGCNLCPPVDQMMQELAEWPDVLPLSLHVDYWDFIGWADTFALKSNTERQTFYAPRTSRGRLFTPLVVIGGMHMVEGYVPMQTVDYIKAHEGVETGVSINVDASDDGFAVHALSDMAFRDPAVVTVVTYTPSEAVAIRRGDNAGRNAEYTNVVTGWQVLGTWDGTEPLQLQIPSPSQNAAVLVQMAGQGMIMAAARLQ